ncbi:MAG: hexitol phosphatase HxpB [Flavobacteriales bacterium]|nr:hexitol phosphatase HxpB [Flavobacteriales bacterium]
MKLGNFEAVIFDMDGVLIDSEPFWKIAMEEVFKSVGCPLTKKDFQKTVGLRIDEVIEFWFQEIGWNNVSPKEVENKIIDRMIALISEHGKPLKGVLETLDFLRSKNIKIGLGTSSYSVLIEAVLNTLKIAGKFDFVHSAEDEKYGKPHPAVYLTVAENLEVSPRKCLVIEDSLNGIISGKAAQMKVVCIPEKTHNPEPKLSISDWMFEDMNQFLSSFR